MNKKKSGNYFFIFVVLLALFLTPLIVAVVLYNKKPYWLYYKTVNKGHLILTPINLQQFKLSPGKKNYRSLKQLWFLFYLTQSPCRHLCQKNLYSLQHITQALGKNRYRVNYGLIVTENLIYPLINKDSKLLQYRITKEKLSNFFLKLGVKNLKEGYFIADPFGRIILYYLPNVQGKAIYDDLNRLLTVSTLG